MVRKAAWVQEPIEPRGATGDLPRTGMRSASPSAPVALLIAQQEGRNALLLRYTDHGQFVGESWHEGIEGAQTHAVEEYGVQPDGWVDVPDWAPRKEAEVVDFLIRLHSLYISVR